MKILSIILTLCGLLIAPLSQASEHKIALEKADNNIRDVASLQRGAVLFSNYCMACHSVKYMRYNMIAKRLNWSNDKIIAKMSHGLSKPFDKVMTRMHPGVANEVFGTKIPDLSLMARLKGTDYIYSFITGFYQDKKGKWNNKYLPGTAMPFVLQGLKNHEAPKAYQQSARDIANFLDYVGEPNKVKRWDLGWKVVVFLLILFILLYLLKKEYWRDVPH